MRSIFLIFVSGCCLGCGLADDPDMRELKNSLRITGDEVVAKQDESIVILRENTTALAAIKSLSDKHIELSTEIVSLLKQQEASLVKSNPNEKEADPASALEPQEVAKEPASTTPSVAAPAVRLQFYTQEFCGPCRPQRINAQAAADELGIALETFHWETSQPAFEQAKVDRTPHTLIVIDDMIRVRLAGIVEASAIVARVNQELGKAMTGAPATGAIFPVQAAITQPRAWFTVRSVSRWQGYNSRTRVKARQSCGPSGCY